MNVGIEAYIVGQYKMYTNVQYIIITNRAAISAKTHLNSRPCIYMRSLLFRFALADIFVESICVMVDYITGVCRTGLCRRG